MSDRPYVVSSSGAMLLRLGAFLHYRRIREINQILRMFVLQIMESNSHNKGSYDTRAFHCQTAMKVQELSQGCTDRLSRCI
jgi:hypothetical protein